MPSVQKNDVFFDMEICALQESSEIIADIIEINRAEKATIVSGFIAPP